MRLIDDGKKDKPHDGGVDMIQNRFVLGVFASWVNRPLFWCCCWSCFYWVTFLFGLDYAKLQKAPMKLPPFHTRLQHVQEIMDRDFSWNGGKTGLSIGAEYEAVVIWCDGASCPQLRGSEDFRQLNLAANIELTKMRANKDHCKNMAWQSWSPLLPQEAMKHLMSEDGTAAMIYVQLPCQAEMTKKLAPLDRKYGGLRIALGTPNALVLSSLEETEKGTITDMFVAIPISYIIVYLSTGNFWRAWTPFIALCCAFTGTKAATVIIKWIWPNLNFSGPEATVLFVELALCLDYALFFWTRFSQERRLRPEAEHYTACIAKTLQTSGAVIFISMIVIIMCYAAMSFYPDQNTCGVLATNIQLIIGIMFVTFYSLIIPSTFGAFLPSLYDEVHETRMGHGKYSVAVPGIDALKSGLSRGSRSLLTWWSRIVTRAPWLFLMPLVVYALFVPLIWELFNFHPNYDVAEGMFSKTVSEYGAFHTLKNKFNIGRMEPMQVLLEATPIKTEVPQITGDYDGTIMFQTTLSKHGLEADHDDVPHRVAPAGPPLKAAATTSGETSRHKLGEFEGSAVAFTPQFGSLACKFIEHVVSNTKGTEYQLNAGDWDTVWWNASSGTCSPHLMHNHLSKGNMTANGGNAQLVKFFPAYPTTGKQAQDLVSFMWSDAEPNTKGHMQAAGVTYEFKATHYSTLATMMLEEQTYRARAPIILIVLIIAICTIIGMLFTSLGLGLKMVITVIVPIVAEFGLIVGAYQHGWMKWAGIDSTGGLLWSTAYTGMGLILGLAIDYDIFLFARVYERRMEGYDNISSVKLAIAETSGVITVAGTVMCIAFFFVTRAGIYAVSQIGMLYFTGIFIDTYIVRFFVAPAVLCLNETMNYWPGKIPKATKSWDGDLSVIGGAK